MKKFDKNFNQEAILTYTISFLIVMFITYLVLR